MDMHATHLRGVDLNLLPALLALLEERQVTRAAERVFVTQPAMSRALSRLRDVFEDELLVRTRHGYRPTPAAERILEQLHEVVPRLEALFAQEFDPSVAELSFDLLGSDYAVSLLGSGAFRRLHQLSPKSRLHFVSWHDEAFDKVRDGVIDLAFYGGAAPAGLRFEHLLTEPFVCVVSADHPLARRRRLALADYLSYPHAVIDVHGGRQPAVDDALDEIGAQRDVGLASPYHTAPKTLQGTQLIATLPERLVRDEPIEGLAVIAAPKEIPAMDYSMCWSPIVDRDPAHTWLREVVTSVAQSL